jgi:hypothetical protein
MYNGLGTCCSSLLIIAHHQTRYYPPMRTNAHKTNYAPNPRPKLSHGAHTQPKFRTKFHTPKLHIVQEIGKKLYSGKIRENMTKSVKNAKKELHVYTHSSIERI